MSSSANATQGGGAGSEPIGLRQLWEVQGMSEVEWFVLGSLQGCGEGCLILSTRVWNEASQKSGGLTGQPRSEKPSRTMGIAEGRQNQGGLKDPLVELRCSWVGSGFQAKGWDGWSSRLLYPLYHLCWMGIPRFTNSSTCLYELYPYYFLDLLTCVSCITLYSFVLTLPTRLGKVYEKKICFLKSVQCFSRACMRCCFSSHCSALAPFRYAICTG